MLQKSSVYRYPVHHLFCSIKKAEHLFNSPKFSYISISTIIMILLKFYPAAILQWKLKTFGGFCNWLSICQSFIHQLLRFTLISFCISTPICQCFLCQPYFGYVVYVKFSKHINFDNQKHIVFYCGVVNYAGIISLSHLHRPVLIIRLCLLWSVTAMTTRWCWRYPPTLWESESPSISLLCIGH